MRTMPCTGVAVASGIEMETFFPPPGDGGRSPLNVASHPRMKAIMQSRDQHLTSTARPHARLSEKNVFRVVWAPRFWRLFLVSAKAFAGAVIPSLLLLLLLRLMQVTTSWAVMINWPSALRFGTISAIVVAICFNLTFALSPRRQILLSTGVVLVATASYVGVDLWFRYLSMGR